MDEIPSDTDEETKIHRTVSDDGTEIAGRVHGQGPPLILVTGVGDGESRQPLLPLLSERFTCYSMSLRGRGLSGDHPDHSPERLVEDITAFASSIGEPVGVVGHSRGAALAIGAAAETTRISAMAVYEPHLIELYNEEDVARVEDAAERISTVVDEGNLADAVQIFFEDIALVTDDELPAVLAPEAVESLAPTVPVILKDVTQFGLPRPSHMLQLERITMPTLVLHGSQSHSFYTRVVRHLSAHLTDSHVREIAGVGHVGPLLAAETVADELKQFFETTPETGLSRQ